VARRDLDADQLPEWISSYELARALGVTQKSAWFMLHRIRLALQAESFGMASGEVEVDETFIGGAARFMHKSKRRVRITETGTKYKPPVMGILELGGKVHFSLCGDNAVLWAKQQSPEAYDALVDAPHSPREFRHQPFRARKMPASALPAAMCDVTVIIGILRVRSERLRSFLAEKMRSKFAGGATTRFPLQ
jgi:hypothetical protein